MEEEKFEFDVDFQEKILQYTVTDSNGYQALNLYQDTYFNLLEHQIIAKALKIYYKRKKRIPQSKAILKEQLRQMFMSRDFIDALSTEDKTKISKIVGRIYSSPAKDGDELLESTIRFAQYIKLKDTIERVNLTEYAQYETFANEVRKSINTGIELKQDGGIFLIEGIRDRQQSRRTNDDIIPTPFWQINKLTNAGGYNKGTLIVVIGPEKEFKTGMLINVARKLMGHRKKILYIDLENGQNSLSVRIEQSIMNKTKKEILSGEYDQAVLKQFRKYKRLGGEVDIKRMTAGSTCSHVQQYIDSQYRTYGIRYTDIIIDYAALMGSISGKKDDTERISDVYVDMKNLIEDNKFNTCWTANHIVRTAESRFKTKFNSTDTAKCIDIVRHVDVAFGFNRSDLDMAGGTVRLQVIDQRDGVQDGFALFKINIPNQRLDEVNKQELKDYYEALKKSQAGIRTVKVKSDLD